MSDGHHAPSVPRLSVAIITRNEEANLERCLRSVRDLASDVVIVDSGSTDRTRAIAEAAGARFEYRAWQGFVTQKNAALESAEERWVLCLDADEAVSPELAGTIRAALAGGEPEVDGFLVNRLNFYLGAWIRHVWYPEWRLRLVRRDRARWVGPDPHERLRTSGRTTRLEGHLLHYSYRSLDEHLQRTLRYARASADQYARDGFVVRWHHLAISPWAAFFKQLLLRQGWRDGWRGWVISFATLLKVFAKYAFLFERRLAGRPPPPSVRSKP